MADIHVHLERVQFEKNNFQNRFKHDEKWNTMSVVSGLISIREKKYASHERDWELIRRRLPQFEEQLNYLTPLISESLAETNISIIEAIAARLDIKSRMVRDFPTEERGSARVLELCRYYGASTYLSGPSGSRDLNLEDFRTEGVDVIFLDSAKMPKMTSLGQF